MASAYRYEVHFTIFQQDPNREPSCRDITRKFDCPMEARTFLGDALQENVDVKQWCHDGYLVEVVPKVFYSEVEDFTFPSY